MRTITRRQALINSAVLAGLPLATMGQEATPEAGLSSVETFREILAQLPQSLLPKETEPSVICFWADLAVQFASVGGSWAEEETSFQVLRPLALASPYFNYALDPELEKAVGFNADAISQALYLGQPPAQLNVFRGTFDRDTLVSAWEASGYKQIDDADIWSLGDELDFDSVIGQRLIAEFNQVAILPSGDLVFSPSLDLIQEITGHAEGDPSLADEDALGMVLPTLPETLVSAIVTNGAFLAGRPEPRGGEGSSLSAIAGVEPDDAEVGQSTRIFVIGITAGFTGPVFVAEDPSTPEPAATPVTGDEFTVPEGGLVATRFEMTSEELAGQKVETVISVWESANSFADDTPYVEKMTIEGSQVEGTIAEVDFIPVSSPSVWYDLVLRQDLLPFMDVKG